LLTQVSLATAPSRQAVANVIGHYAKQVDITFQVVGSSENAGTGFVGLAVNREKTSEENPAFFDPNDKSIRMNIAGGKLSSKMYDYNNLLSVLLHEKDHKQRDEPSMTDRNLGHMSHAFTYFAGVANDNFLGGTEDFQGGVLNQMATEMNGALEDGHSENEVLDLARKTNTAIAKTGFHFRYEAPSNPTENGKFSLGRTEKKK